MKIRSIAILFILAAIMAIAPKAQADNKGRPIVLLFETNKGDGADKDTAASTTKAIKYYLKDSERVSVIVFDRNSPTVLRAIMDKKLTADTVASYSSRAERIEVAKTLSFDYAAGSEVSMKNGQIEIRLWVAKVGGGKNDKWESVGTASSTGSGSNDLENAMQCAASAAVTDIVNRGMATLPRIEEQQPETGDESSALNVDSVLSPKQPNSSDYKAQADNSLDSGNIALAIQQYSQAVSADPANIGTRIKLADAYARKGLYDKAADELNRAESFGGDKNQIDAERNRIEDFKNGLIKEDKKPSPNANTSVTKIPEDSNISDDAATAVDTQNTNKVVMSPSKANTSAAKMIEGDKLWKSGDPDSAALAYKEAAKISPSDWRAYERLAIVYASMAMFNESRNTILILNKVQPNPTDAVKRNRYAMFKKAFDKYFASLLNQYNSDSADFSKHVINRESYYSTVKGISLRMESMAKFLDVLNIPDASADANLHRSLACGLMSQAASNQLDYLESNNDTSKANAVTFVTQAKKEMETASKLDAGYDYTK